MFGSRPSRTTYCGLFHTVENVRKYIPQVKMAAHTTILSSVARTTLTQTFENTDTDASWGEVKYAFPLIDGVSVVAFTCTIGDRIIKGVVKEKQKAREVYEEAKDRGESAALFEQVAEASDVFLTSVGNVPPKSTVRVEITYLGELTHDAEVDGIRTTIPTAIAPRYGDLPESMRSTTAELNTTDEGGLEIVVDAQMPDGSVIKSIQSPSHPISVSIGTLSTAPEAESSLRHASASLSLPKAGLEKDFVLQVVATNTSNPVAMLEKHPTLPNERALMATLVPKFALPPERPEIVFVCDRSGSMGGSKIANLRTALQVFLKSLPVGVKFNICSFGSSHSFLWEQSRTYDRSSLEEATRHVSTFDSNMGGTQMYPAVEDVFKRRFEDMNLEVLLLTDGDIWDADELFKMIRKNREESKDAIRLFTLAIGSGSSSALTEGAARAGNGFSQSVGDKEKMNNKVVRMLKAALTPHINDYTLEVKYEAEGSEDDFELVDKVDDCLVIDDAAQEKTASPAPQKTTSLFDPSVDVDTEMGNTGGTETKYDHLPRVATPKLLQSPFKIPSLYPFNRTSVYMLMSEETVQRPVKSVVLRGTSRHGPLELEIPVTTLDEPGETVHQLAARKAVKELEEGAGWLYHARDSNQKLLPQKHMGQFYDVVEREAVRLGVKYQVGGKWCSFVAVDESESAKDGRVVELDTVISKPEAAAFSPMARCRGRGMPSGRGVTAFAMAAPAPPPPASLRDRGYPSETPALTSADPVDTRRCGTANSFGGAPQQGQFGSSLFGAAPQQAQQSAGGPFGAAPQQAQQFSGRLFEAAPRQSSGWRSSRGLDDSGAQAEGFSTSGANPASSPPLFGGGGDPTQGLQAVTDSAAPSGDLFGSDVAPVRTKRKAMKAARFAAPRSGDVSDDAEPDSDSDPSEALVWLQGFDGSWSSSEGLFHVIGTSQEKIEGALRARGEEWSEGLAKGGADALATAGVLAFLRAKLAEKADEWEMIADKGWEWLVGLVPGLEGRREDLDKCLGGLFG